MGQKSINGGGVMYYIMEGKRVTQTEHFLQIDETKEDMGCIGVFGQGDIEKIAEQFGISYHVFEEAMQSRSAKYETLDGFDFICVNMIDYGNLYAGQRRVMIHLTKDVTLFFCDDPMRLEKILNRAMEDLGEKVSVNRVIFEFFNRLTKGEPDIFDQIEKEILDLEKAVITSKKGDCVKEIISLRKRRMILKKYFEQFMDVLDGISENENEIFDKKTLRYFKVLDKRVNHLFMNVLNLRDYVTQVRESYQAEVDISLNTTMKVFTVITAIFLPLTLIVGWYGMNFEMPEYGWKYGYAMVIGLSILVIVVGIGFFKKKHWF